MTKMTNAAASSLSANGPDMKGETAFRGWWRPERPFPAFPRAAGASDRAAARVIFVILCILSILYPAVFQYQLGACPPAVPGTVAMLGEQPVSTPGVLTPRR